MKVNNTIEDNSIGVGIVIGYRKGHVSEVYTTG